MHAEAHDVPSYGLWWIVALNAGVFVFFTLSFFKPRTQTDWRTLGSFWAFIVALFAEMYGFPLTIYLLAGWLQARFPQTDFLAHDSGHLWHTVFGFGGNPHLNPIHLLSNGLIIAGFFLLSSAWKVLHEAQASQTLARSGPYRLIRHPQYAAFLLIMIGFLVQWPTLLTLLMFPVLAVRYVRLAHREEREVAAELGDAWAQYAARTPRWLPRWRAGT